MKKQDKNSEEGNFLQYKYGKKNDKYAKTIVRM